MYKNIYEKIQRIEKEFSVDEIKVGDIPLWPFIRCPLFNIYTGTDISATVQDKNTIKKRVEKVKKHVSALRYSSCKGFTVCDHSLLFTTDYQFRYIEGKLINQHTDLIEQNLEEYLPIVQLIKNNDVNLYSTYIDNLLIDDICKVKSIKNRIAKKDITGCDILDKIIIEMEITFDYLKYVSWIIAAIDFYKKWFFKTKPKNIILECFYDSKMPAIYAAKQLGIPTVEFQHGLPGYAYKTYINIKKNPYPDFFLCYGKKYKTLISENIYNPDNIINVGNYFLSLTEKSQEKNRLLFWEKYKKYKGKIIVIVAGQTLFDKELLEFSNEVARKANDIVIIYVPRILKEYHNKMNRSNLIIEHELNIYQLMQNSSVTIGVTSTCIVESLYFGTPAILIDFYGFASSFYRELLKDIQSISFVQNIDEMINEIRTKSKVDRKIVKAESEDFYEQGYELNIKTFMEKFSALRYKK